ncbi:MAG: hypothetical protein ACXWQO_04215 [Bdellovibrionota bacterium]
MQFLEPLDILAGYAYGIRKVRLGNGLPYVNGGAKLGSFACKPDHQKTLSRFYVFL